MRNKKKKIYRVLAFILAAAVVVAMVWGAASSCAGNAYASDLMEAIDYIAVVDGREAGTDGEADENYKEIARTIEADGTTELLLGIYARTGEYVKYYVSIRDLAALLYGTDKQFNFAYDNSEESYVITRGEPYSDSDEALHSVKPMLDENGQLVYDDNWNLLDENGNIMVMWEQEPQLDANGQYVTNEYGQVLDTDGYPFVIGVQLPQLDENGNYVYDENGQLLDTDGQPMADPSQEDTRPDYEYLDLYVNPLMVDGHYTRYYSYQLSSQSDIYLSMMDAEMLFDITFEFQDGNVIHIKTDGFSVDLDDLSENGAFSYLNGVLVGDAKTGEIFFSDRSDYVEAVASISKLMTYMVVERYIELGKITVNDVVTISKNVENLAYGGYGVVFLNEGDQVTVNDLIYAMLVGSSNESALALAEYTAGSEEAFAEQMNLMASIIGLQTAEFYNASGLTYYSGDVYGLRHYNRMTAEDLFTMLSALLRKYPEVKEYTSTRSVWLDSMGVTLSNTNTLFANIPDLIGMKTGTTDEAGCCLAAAVPVECSDGEHILIAIVLGADDNIDRNQVPEMLLTYGKKLLEQRDQAAADSEQSDNAQNDSESSEGE